MNPYKEFVKLMLPVEVRESFELVKVEVNTYPSDTKTDELGEMHIYLDEESTPPKGRTDLTPNGFFPAIKINDYPIRGHKVTLHVRRRRWTDPEGHNVSTDWDNMVQEHSRLSPDFVTFGNGRMQTMRRTGTCSQKTSVPTCPSMRPRCPTESCTRSYRTRMHTASKVP